MNFLENLIPAPLAETIGTTLMHSLWELAAVALVLLIVLQIVPRKSARTRYHLGVAAMLLMLVLPIATFFTVYQPAVEAAEPLPDISMMLGNGQILELEEHFAAREAPVSFFAGITNFFNANAHLFFLLWIAGALFFTGRFVIGYVQVQRLRRLNTQPVPPEVVAALARLKVKLGLNRAVRILQSGSVDTPMVIGALRPVVLLPFGLLSGLTPEQVECILAHELAHIRRWDYLVNIFQSFVEIVLFFHPAIWWVSHLVREERENCCDETVLALKHNNIVYARALLNLETLRTRQPDLAMASNGGSLFKRIKRITGAEARETRFYSRGLFVAIMTLTLVIVLSTTGADKMKASAPVVNLSAPELTWEEAPMDIPADSVSNSPQITAPIAPTDSAEEEGDDWTIEVNGVEQPVMPGLQKLFAMLAEIPQVVSGATQNTEELLLALDFGGENASFPQLVSRFSAAQDTPVTRLMLQDGGRDVVIALDAFGEVEEVRVDGEAVPVEEHDYYKALASRTMRGYLNQNDPAPAPPAPPAPGRLPVPPAPPRIGNLPPLPPMPTIGALPPVPTPPERGNMSKEEYNRVMEDYEADMEAWGERVEAQFDNDDWERFGEAMEAWGERFEQQFEEQDWQRFEEDMENWGERMEQEYEHDWEAFGRKMEAWGEQVAERFSDEAKWEDFGENLSRSLESLAGELEKELGDLDTRIQAEVNRAQAEAKRARSESDEVIAQANRYRNGVDRLTRELEADGLAGKGKPFRIKINEDELYVNGDRQSAAVQRKYRRLIEKELGIDVEDEWVEINLKKGDKDKNKDRDKNKNKVKNKNKK
ncbi:MAG: M56 family metallopeptidase [Bacteroidota bacterium]